MKESQIERRLVEGVKRLGGMCLKFVSPGTLGVPDRIIITAKGRVIFVELKTRQAALRKSRGMLSEKCKSAEPMPAWSKASTR